MSVMKNKILLLNSPSGGGKDTLGFEFAKNLGCVTRAFKESLYEIAYPMTKCNGYGSFLHHCTDRELKETPSDLFRGYSPRGFLIHVSEDIIKPAFGQDFFGVKAAESISEEDFEKGVVFTDGGFIEEVYPLIEKFGGDNVYIIQFCGQGKNSFEGDSRNWIDTDDCHVIKMEERNEDIWPALYMKLILREVVNT